MSLLTLASGASRYRGYDYYKSNKMIDCNQISDIEFEGRIAGSGKKKYELLYDGPEWQYDRFVDMYIDF